MPNRDTAGLCRMTAGHLDFRSTIGRSDQDTTYWSSRIGNLAPTMETMFQFLDEVEDVILTTFVRLRHSLARMPRERRRVARLPESMGKPPATPGR